MFRLFGPPGTGKTTTLLNMVDKALNDGTAPTKIAFLAFTKKAATEAKERAAKRFNLDPEKDLFYFRTLHSLAFSLIDVNKDQIMQPEHYRELGKAIGFDLEATSDGDSDEGFGQVTKINHPVLNLVNLARLCKNDLRKEYNHSNVSQDWITVKYIHDSYMNYKNAFELYDFTDMLELFIKEGHHLCPHFELTFLDEAQDLSPLQWDIAHLLDGKSNKMYCAGDDDQAIYKWAGADVDHFINLEGGVETLTQSYRIPKNVHNLANNIAARIKNRFPKKYEPKQELGSVQRVYSVDELDLSQGSWLILAQAQYFLSNITEQLKSMGVFFETRRGLSVPASIATAVMSWEALRKGKTITGEQARKMYAYLLAHYGVKRGYKKLPGLMDDDKVTMDELVADHGLAVDPTLIWHEALKLIPETERAYLTALLRRGEKITAEPRIKLSTIHGAKGGEADNVVILTDLTFAAANHAMDHPDEIHRVFYVAVTRTRENLFLVEPENFERCYHL